MAYSSLQKTALPASKQKKKKKRKRGGGGRWERKTNGDKDQANMVKTKRKVVVGMHIFLLLRRHDAENGRKTPPSFFFFLLGLRIQIRHPAQSRREVHETCYYDYYYHLFLLLLVFHGRSSARENKTSGAHVCAEKKKRTAEV